MGMTVSMIACVSKNYALGNKGQLLYHLPDDMKRFRRLTTGHTVIMGRKTFESLPNGPLPNRCNIIISKTLKNSDIPGVDVVQSLSQALIRAGVFNDELDGEVFIIGGESIYRRALETDIIDNIYLTVVQDVPSEADVFFPTIPDNYDIAWGECHSKDARHAYDFNFEDWKRIKTEI